MIKTIHCNSFPWVIRRVSFDFTLFSLSSIVFQAFEILESTMLETWKQILLWIEQSKPNVNCTHLCEFSFFDDVSKFLFNYPFNHKLEFKVSWINNVETWKQIVYLSIETPNLTSTATCALPLRDFLTKTFLSLMMSFHHCCFIITLFIMYWNLKILESPWVTIKVSFCYTLFFTFFHCLSGIWKFWNQ